MPFCQGMEFSSHHLSQPNAWKYTSTVEWTETVADSLNPDTIWSNKGNAQEYYKASNSYHESTFTENIARPATTTKRIRRNHHYHLRDKGLVDTNLKKKKHNNIPLHRKSRVDPSVALSNSFLFMVALVRNAVL